MDRLEDVGSAWDRALAAEGSTLLEFVTDPQITPLPPHVRAAMLKKTLKALARGDEDAKGVAIKRFQGKWAKFSEHAKDLLAQRD